MIRTAAGFLKKQPQTAPPMWMRQVSLGHLACDDRAVSLAGSRAFLLNDCTASKPFLRFTDRGREKVKEVFNGCNVFAKDEAREKGQDVKYGRGLFRFVGRDPIGAYVLREAASAIAERHAVLSKGPETESYVAGVSEIINHTPRKPSSWYAGLSRAKVSMNGSHKVIKAYHRTADKKMNRVQYHRTKKKGRAALEGDCRRIFIELHAFEFKWLARPDSSMA